MNIEPAASIGSHQTHNQAVRLSTLARRSETANQSELKAVCGEFETLFVKMMLDSMRSTLSDDTLIPKNSGEKLFEDELYEEYARRISQTANLGIADMMYNQLSETMHGTTVDITR